MNLYESAKVVLGRVRDERVLRESKSRGVELRCIIGAEATYRRTLMCNWSPCARGRAWGEVELLKVPICCQGNLRHRN